MIKGFEKITQELNKEEVRIANHLFQVFWSNPKYRTSKLIISELKRVFGINLSQPRLRKIIHFIRMEMGRYGFIIATRSGYKYTEDIQELEDYKISLDQRINSQLEIWNELARIIRSGGGKQWTDTI